MGAYINPPEGTKEEWLAENAEEIPFPNPAYFNTEPNKLQVCWVDNGPFTAAGIAFSREELAVFVNPQDWRPKKWYLAPINKLLEVSELGIYRPDLVKGK